MHLFYTPDIKGKNYTLSEEESRHAIKVLRLKISDEIQLTDGKGFFYIGKITDTNHKRCKIDIIETIKKHRERDFTLHIAIAPTKNIDRFEWFIEKVTEIGIDKITPIICERSERKSIKPDRIEKVIISAIKQSQKANKPILNPLIKFSDFIKTDRTAKRYIAHCEARKREALSNIKVGDDEVLILIGPEGDFSHNEIVAAHLNNFEEITLGKARLRTETAGVVACSVINSINT